MLAPSLAVLATTGMFPALAALVFNRSVNWMTAAYAWPAVVVLVLVAFVATATTFVARVHHLTRHPQVAREARPLSVRRPELAAKELSRKG